VAVGAVASAILHLGLVVAAERSRWLRDPVYADKERNLTRIEQELPPGSPLVLYVGTSRAGNGFDAARSQSVLTDALGRPAGVFNWGIPASGPVTHLLHLRRLLADGHRPTLILLEILPPTLAALPDGPLEGRFTDGTLLAWDELDLVAGYGFPVGHLREQRRKVVMAPWYGLRFQIVGRLASYLLPFHERHDWGRTSDANGWSPILVDDVDDAMRAAGLKRAEKEYRDILAKMKFGDGPMRALRDLLALCREHGIPVVLVRMPEGSAFRAFYPRPVATRVEQLVGELAAEYGCRVADCREWMPDDAFADGHHLLRVPASAFSERLTREAIEPALRSATGGGKP
jgi:hypothetical protein